MLPERILRGWCVFWLGLYAFLSIGVAARGIETAAGAFFLVNAFSLVIAAVFVARSWR